MAGTALRDSRLELRTTEATKQLIAEAASLDGMDVTTFVLSSASDKARKVIRDHNLIKLSHQGQLNLVNALNASSQPTEAMKELMALSGFEK